MKLGYKQTEVGVIPEDWEVKTLGSLTTLLTNGFVGTATTAYINGDDGVLYIQGYNVQENGFNFHGIKRVSKAFHTRNKKSCLQAGDLLTIQTGDIGVTTVVPPELVGANCHALIISRLRKQESEPGYYCQYFNSERGRVAFKEIETGTTMKHLNGGDMKRLFLPSPPLPEQTAIAEALSDVDGLLGGLDRLIAKKRDLKQAAMQQLLTGQTRLPGFHGEWKVKRLEQSCELITKGTTPTSMGRNFTQSGVNFLKAESLSESGETIPDKVAFIDAATHKLLNRSQLKTGDLLISIAGVLGRVGRVSQGILPANTNQALAIVRLGNSSESEPNFLFYCLRSPMTTKQISDVNVQAAQANISLQNVRDLEIYVPPTRPEQTAIAAVLSEMDGELAVLEQRREKTRALKQAMMQELLTGRTRLL
jgi:type I restriction enzyme S subunit